MSDHQGRSFDPEIRYELMRPQEILAAQDKASVIYVPVGPMEWHGPHLPIGTDMLHAYEIALNTAQITGGVVHPSIPLGTETYLTREELQFRGFTGDERVIGMDFPGLSLPSLYNEESAFGVIMHDIIRLLKRQGYKLIVILNGHEATNQISTLNRIAIEETEPGKVTVIFAFPAKYLGPWEGHAGLDETSLMMVYYPESVAVDLLPELPTPLSIKKFGILDLPTCFGDPTPEFTIRTNQDPRYASADVGNKHMTKEVQELAIEVKTILDNLNG
jgi:creatinine amidohydrolase